MPYARPSIARLVPLFLILATAAPAAAQITFRGIRAGTPPEQARSRLEALGYRYLGVDQAADHVYTGPDGSELVLMMDQSGVVHFEERWEGSPAVVRRRSRVLADSITRTLGAPGARSEEATVAEWSRGGDALQVRLAAEPSSRYRMPFTTLAVVGNGYASELQRRATHNVGGRSVPDDTLNAGEWTIVGGDGRTTVEVETSRVQRPAPGVYRTRMREDWWWTLRMTNGMMYMSEVGWMDLDCRRMRWRQLRAVRYFRDQVVEGTPLDRPRVPAVWTAPAAGTDSHRMLRSSCDAAGAVRFSAAQVRVLGIEWGTPAAQVRTRLEARGYRFRSVDDFGDHVFAGPGSSEARASFDSAGLGQLELRWTGPTAALQRRFRALSDSLTRTLGSPSRPSGYPWELFWNGEGAQLIATYRPPGRRRSQAEAALLGQSDAFVAAEWRRNAP
ncbi:MAG TPA: surface-adhesin E family protein [Longimicrobium sp.]|nr:surface-adhesin E family protein [Longimicrobium sp.]